MHLSSRSAPLLLVMLALASCAQPADTLADGAPVLENYAVVLHAQYEDALTGATELRTACTPLFSGTATQQALDDARQAWRDSRPAYMQSEYARFYEGPIDAAFGGDPAMSNYEALLNSWPLDENVIDYVQGPGGSVVSNGLINMPGVAIEEQLLIDRNGADGEKNITAGYHAIEFLLWGQDFAADGPGNRPFTDYVVGTGTDADRRREYLDVATQLLIDDVTAVRTEWDPGAANYRADFVAMPPREALALVLLGMGKLAEGELAGQRIHTPFTTKDQEDEHSCFSDNTVADYTNDVRGLVSAYFGTYTRTDGTTVGDPAHSLSALVHARDPMLDDRLRDALQDALTDIQEWPEVASCPSAALQGECPFDQLILGVDTDPGRMAVQELINDLHAIAIGLAQVATALGIDLSASDFASQ
ncbi:MAG: imelysin family protein [Sandaracinus sp.]